jgi:hypothetical protein
MNSGLPAAASENLFNLVETATLIRRLRLERQLVLPPGMVRIKGA